MSPSRRLTIYVAHHRPRLAPLPPLPYVAVCNVRADGSRPPGFRDYDDEGGLPHVNAAYNELSVLHRLQQKAQTEWVGLAHYRRVLLAHRPAGRRGEQPGTTHVRGWDWQHPQNWSADEASLLAAVGDADWLTPMPYDVRRAGYRNLWEHYMGNHPSAPLLRAATVLAARHPGWEPLTDYLRRESRLIAFNMFLGRRSVLDRYGAFLWPVLEDCDGSAETGYQGRWAGFVAERLHGYWLAQQTDSVMVRRLPLGLLDVPRPPLRQRLTGFGPAVVSEALITGVRRTRYVVHGSYRLRAS